MRSTERRPSLETPASSFTDWGALVAHQLKTPLCALDARLAQTESVDPGALRRDIRKITAMIDQLQLLSRCRHSAGANMRSVRLADLARNVTAELAPLAIRKAQEIGFRDLSGSATVQADPDLATEALRNLVENAIKYTPFGGRVEIATTRGGNIHVLDQGIGIPPGEIEQVFEPFHRGSNVRDMMGTGLGLFLVREIMAQNGGQVDHRNRRTTRGSTFTLRFRKEEPQSSGG